jgi:hypothetical protein
MDEDQARALTAKLANIADKGLTALTDIVEDEEQDGRLKLDATKTALEALGFLGKGRVNGMDQQQPQTAIQVNIGQSAFEVARERALMGSKALVHSEGGE